MWFMGPVAAHTGCWVALSWISLQARKRLNAPGRRGGEGEAPGANTDPLCGLNFNDLRHQQGKARPMQSTMRDVGPRRGEFGVRTCGGGAHPEPGSGRCCTKQRRVSADFEPWAPDLTHPYGAEFWRAWVHQRRFNCRCAPRGVNLRWKAALGRE